MSTSDTCTIFLPNAASTAVAGESLARTIYKTPLLVLLSGEMGAGKTSFVQGLAKGLGIRQTVTSPTYALEQIYVAPNGTVLTHIDLYRLNEAQAEHFVEERQWSDGITCVEWSHRLPKDWGHDQPHILVDITEKENGRELTCTFKDMSIPTNEQIESWRKEVMLPININAHCNAVAAFTTKLTHDIEAKGLLVRHEAAHKAAMLHDLIRFVDFKIGGAPEGFTNSTEEQQTWHEWQNRYSGLHHEAACARFLHEQGYGEIGNIVALHGLHQPLPEHATIEQKVVFYADKRFAGDQLVSIDERFEDFNKRYGPSAKRDEWHAESKRVEKELGMN